MTQKKVADIFSRHVKEALKHFHEPLWLGNKSYLSTPFFLGQHLIRQPDNDTALGRGNVLQQLLLEVAVELVGQTEEQHSEAKHLREQIEWGRTQQRSRYLEYLADHLKNSLESGQLLYWSFFSRETKSQTQEFVRLYKLKAMARSSFSDQRDKAIDKLAELLVKRLKPALRLETPPMLQATMKRNDVDITCTNALREGQMVALMGSGGIGKTTMAAQLVRNLGETQPAFWYTIRPGLKDNINDLLLELSYFLHSQYTSIAWLHIATEKGKIDIDRVLGMVLSDLKSLQPPKPILCFDEIDLLRPLEVDAHAQLLAFLVELHRIHETPLLLIGQYIPQPAKQQRLVPDLPYILEGLDRIETKQLLIQAGIELPVDDLGRLHAYTDGNPRLLDLFIGLSRSGASLENALISIATTPSVDTLVGRILQNLVDAKANDEIAVLMSLAVFRRSAPGDAWEKETLVRLIDRHLVQRDERGGVMIIPAFRMALYTTPSLSQEDRETLHLEAARIRAMGGEHTAAAYHYVQANQPGMALWEWFPHRIQEINQGQGRAALELLQQISATNLSDDDQRILALARSDLQLLSGEYKQVVPTLDTAAWPNNDSLTALAARIRGNLADLQRDYDAARSAYRAGLETVERLASEAAQFHKTLGWVAMQQRNMDLAWTEALRARYEAAHLQGDVQVELGDYVAAHVYYSEALELAAKLAQRERSEGSEGEAKTCDHLAQLLVRQERFAEAETYWKRANVLYQRIGRMNRCAGMLVNQALLYNQTEQPDKALGPAQEALTLFEQLKDSKGIAVAVQNLAEAYQKLGNLDEAQHFAWLVVDENETGTLPDGLRVLGEVKLAKGDLHAAEYLIMQSIEVAEQNKDRYLEAYGRRALGRVYFAQYGMGKAQRAFVRAQKLFNTLGLSHEVERTEILLIVGSNRHSER